MRILNSKVMLLAASAAVLAAGFTLPADANYRFHRGHHHHRYTGRVLTVTQAPQPVYAPDPFHGPAAIITGPVAIGAAVVSVPFRAAAAIFPPQGDPGANPLVLVGAPVHVAGQFAQFPFYAVGTAFGAPPNTNF